MGDWCTGIGSRDTPKEICILMTRFARLQRRRVRSGGAEAADESFESNWNLLPYLPEPGFRQKRGHHRYREEHLEFADSILKCVFPYPIRKEKTLAFFRRNVFQVLGLCSSVNEIVLSDFVICWTPDGAVSMADYELGVTGGTGIAINIADLYHVPVYNLRRNDHHAKIRKWCQKRENQLGLRFEHTSGVHFYANTGEVFDPGTFGEGAGLSILAG